MRRSNQLFQKNLTEGCKWSYSSWGKVSHVDQAQSTECLNRYEVTTVDRPQKTHSIFQGSTALLLMTLGSSGQENSVDLNSECGELTLLAALY